MCTRSSYRFFVKSKAAFLKEKLIFYLEYIPLKSTTFFHFQATNKFRILKNLGSVEEIHPNPNPVYLIVN